MRRVLYLILIGVAFAGADAAWRAEQPIARSPSGGWEASISSPDFSAQSSTVAVDGVVVEAMILRPATPTRPVGAVVFVGGSGDGLFQNSAPGVLKTHLQDIFLPRGIAVVYANKRGMGGSTGNWMNNTIEGRASDLIAVAKAVRDRPGVDPTRAWIAGHSQGGWVVLRAGAQDPDTAFVLDFMGPLRSPRTSSSLCGTRSTVATAGPARSSTGPSPGKTASPR